MKSIEVHIKADIKTVGPVEITVPAMCFLRFIRAPDFESPSDPKYPWYWDTYRPLKDDPDGQPYVAVQCYAERGNPNTYVRINGEMRLLFTDLLEYYAVCVGCWESFRHLQWSGSTRGPSDWRERANAALENHRQIKGWCEFCDPIFGSGGWSR